MAQHDYAIANQSGAAFRADLNNALAAIVSQNSGAAEPSTTFAYMRWADTTAGVMKMRNGANSAWITLYQLDGEWTSIALENGTAAAPSLYFKDSGTDTGIYSSGTDALDFATGGTRRVGISSAGDVTIYGQGDLRLADSDSSNWVAFQAPATVSSNVTWTLPATDGTNGQSLQTNGSGALSWATVTGVQMTLATAVASTSGTSIDFTGIPSWVKRVTVMFDGVSTNGTSNFMIRLGTSSGIEATGYAGSSSQNGAGNAASNETTGIGIRAGNTATTLHGLATICLIGSNAWAVSYNFGRSDTPEMVLGGFSKTLSGTLDRIRITTANGTDTFDAGTINIMYEG